MILDNRWQTALSGEYSSSAEVLPIADGGAVSDRFAVASELVAGKSVLHVGCVDHTPLLDKKVADGTWMHAVRCDPAAKCGGVGIHAEGADETRRRGYADPGVGGAAAERAIAGTCWDQLFVREMLEHVDDPVGYLTGTHATWAGSADSVVATVPNA